MADFSHVGLICREGGGRKGGEGRVQIMRGTRAGLEPHLRSRTFDNLRCLGSITCPIPTWCVHDDLLVAPPVPGPKFGGGGGAGAVAFIPRKDWLSEKVPHYVPPLLLRDMIWIGAGARPIRRARNARQASRATGAADGIHELRAGTACAGRGPPLPVSTWMPNMSVHGRQARPALASRPGKPSCPITPRNLKPRGSFATERR